MTAGQIVHDHGLLLHVEHRVTLSELYKRADELVEIAVCLQKIPVEPGNLVVLAVSVIIAVLGISKLVAA